MKHADFVHLHLHTQYSLLDGTIRLADLFKMARDYKMPAVAITDHGNMYGAVDFYQQAYKAGIKPIIGCELYVAPKSRFDKTSEGPGETARHLIVLAKNLQGYRNLIKLTSCRISRGILLPPARRQGTPGNAQRGAHRHECVSARRSCRLDPQRGPRKGQGIGQAVSSRSSARGITTSR